MRPVPEDATTTPMLRALLHTLVDVQETLHQCEPGGYITMQCQEKYGRALRQRPRREGREQQERLKDRVATQALSMVLYEQYRTHGLVQAVHDAGAGLRKPRGRAPNLAEAAALKKQSTHRLM